ncbi:MAG: Fe-S cluster assembly protein NifU [Planctomycetota bacterium]|nr:Fe-S cluster assembly protein NifU [Planctomycetota bacterium]
MWEYSDKLKEHFFNPRNVGEIEKPDAVGEVGNMTCGDALRLTLKIDRPSERILDARFKTFGCGSAIASSSALTEMIKGKTLAEAAKITNDDIANYLGGLPKEKMHCSVMGREALDAAIAGFRGLPYRKPEDEGTLICKCFGVTEEKIRRVAIENNLTTPEEVTNYTKAGGGCGSCVPEIERILADVWKGRKPAAPVKAAVVPAKKKLTNIQKMQLIQETIDHEIRPLLKADGGDIELVDVEGNNVLVTLRGACSGCRAAEFTLASLVEGKLKEFVADDLKVVEIKG